jgi:hypothetical protein
MCCLEEELDLHLRHGSRICQAHFDPAMVIVDVKYKHSPDIHPNPIWTLAKGAIPTRLYHSAFNHHKVQRHLDHYQAQAHRLMIRQPGPKQIKRY